MTDNFLFRAKYLCNKTRSSILTNNIKHIQASLVVSLYHVLSRYLGFDRTVNYTQMSIKSVAQAKENRF